MPIPWLTVLQAVPWGEVIRNAPKVADGAKKLWQSAGRHPAATPAPPAETQPVRTAEDAIAALQAQLTATDAAVAELRQQMLTSSELIKSLADQNAELIRRVEAHRIRGRWLIAIAVGLGFAVIWVSLVAPTM